MPHERYRFIHLDGIENHQELLEERLSSWAEVVHASEVEEAASWARKGTHDLILVGELKAESFFSLTNLNLPVVALVSSYDPDFSRKVIALGAQDVLERDKAGTPEFSRALAHAMERGMSMSELRLREHNLQSMINHLDVPVFIKDLNGRYLLVNDKGAANMGFTPEKMAGMHDRDLFGAEQAEEIRRSDERVIREGVSLTYVRKASLPTGPKILLTTKSPHVSVGGKVVGIIGVAQDVTDQIQIEETLKLAERVQDTLLSLTKQLSAAMSVKDVGLILAKESQRVFAHDAFALTLYDESTQTRLGVYAEDLMPGCDKPAEVDVESLRRTYLDEKSQSALYRSPKLINRANDGEEANLQPFGNTRRRSRSLLIAPIIWEGSLIGSITTQSYTPEKYGAKDLDVLQSFSNLCGGALVRLRAEEALRNSKSRAQTAQKMEAIGRMAGGVAHDFNNVLSAIIGFSKLGLDKIEEGHPLERNLREIASAGERAAGLTKQLLAISRRQVLDPKVLDLNKEVSSLEGMLGTLLGEGVTLDLRLYRAPVRILADQGQIEQVLLNLAVNARDAMPKGGKLSLTTFLADRMESSPPDDTSMGSGVYALLRVEDTGCGMDESTTARIFEPFYTTKEKGKGTGLGLSTVYGIVKQSGGTIRVRSRPGEGSCFDLYFPIQTEERAPDKPASKMRRRDGSETILLVEDEELVRRLAREVLEDAGYRVLEASGAAAALDYCSDHKGTIHLMVTDVVMPHMNGPQLAKKAGGARPEMKVMYMSGYADEIMDEHGVRSDVVPFLDKPFTPGRLVRSVQDALDL